jgi:hypothetical protein
LIVLQRGQALSAIDFPDATSSFINYPDVRTSGRIGSMKSKQIEFNSQRQHTTRHSLPLGMLLLLTMLVWAGCQHEPKAVAHINPGGTYALVSVDSNKVPCAVQHEGAKLTIKSGTFIINADGTCSSRMVFTPPSGRDATRDVNATYTRQGSTLTMKWKGAGMTTGSVEGDTFTMNNEGMIFAYRK